MGNSAFWNWVLIAAIVMGVFSFIKYLRRPASPNTYEVENTFKFRTIIYIILAISIPLWLITFPLFIYLAYRSYVSGEKQHQHTEISKTIVAPRNISGEIEALHKLVASGALSDAEFQAQKKRLLAPR